jgi:Tfp pilus assembly protein FimV
MQRGVHQAQQAGRQQWQQWHRAAQQAAAATWQEGRLPLPLLLLLVCSGKKFSTNTRDPHLLQTPTRFGVCIVINIHTRNSHIKSPKFRPNHSASSASTLWGKICPAPLGVAPHLTPTVACRKFCSCTAPLQGVGARHHQRLTNGRYVGEIVQSLSGAGSKYKCGTAEHTPPSIADEREFRRTLAYPVSYDPEATLACYPNCKGHFRFAATRKQKQAKREVQKANEKAKRENKQEIESQKKEMERMQGEIESRKAEIDSHKKRLDYKKKRSKHSSMLLRVTIN